MVLDKVKFIFDNFWCLEKRSSGNLKIPLDVRDQLEKLMTSHPEFAACAGTTAAFFTQSREWPQSSSGLTAGRFAHRYTYIER